MGLGERRAVGGDGGVPFGAWSGWSHLAEGRTHQSRLFSFPKCKSGSICQCMPASSVNRAVMRPSGCMAASNGKTNPLVVEITEAGTGCR